MAERFSLAHLRDLHRTLESNKAVNQANESTVVEILRLIAEMVVYGDRKSEMLFDFFCEKNMLALFLEIMWTEGGCPVPVHVQILQTLGILVNSVKNDTSLYYLLSNNYINEILIHPHDFQADESLCDQYVSFMKSLSLRLDEKTVQFFFIEETGAFPLLEKAISLLNYEEPMVRIAAQTTVLNIYQVKDSRSREYALREGMVQGLFRKITLLSKEKFSLIMHLTDNHSRLMRAIDAGNQGLDPTDDASVSPQRPLTPPLKPTVKGPKRMTPGRLAKAMSSLDSLQELLDESTIDTDDLEHAVKAHEQEKGAAAAAAAAAAVSGGVEVSGEGAIAADADASDCGLPMDAEGEGEGLAAGAGAGAGAAQSFSPFQQSTPVDASVSVSVPVSITPLEAEPAVSTKQVHTAAESAGTGADADEAGAVQSDGGPSPTSAATSLLDSPLPAPAPLSAELASSNSATATAAVTAATAATAATASAAATPAIVEPAASASVSVAPIMMKVIISKSLDTNRALLKQTETQLIDSISAAEDWLYFLQDLLGLNIFHLKFGLVRHLMEHWLVPHVLDWLSPVADKVSAAKFSQTLLHSNGAPQAAVLSAALTHRSGVCRDVIFEADLQNAKRALLCLMQILRITQDRLLHRAVMIALFHPLNASKRAELIVLEHEQHQKEREHALSDKDGLTGAVGAVGGGEGEGEGEGGESSAAGTPSASRDREGDASADADLTWKHVASTRKTAPAEAQPEQQQQQRPGQELFLSPPNSKDKDNARRNQCREALNATTTSTAAAASAAASTGSWTRRVFEHLLVNSLSLFPAQSYIFDLTSDHLTLTASLFIHRVIENSISIGRYRDLLPSEKAACFTGLGYELALLNFLTITPCGGGAYSKLLAGHESHLHACMRGSTALPSASSSSSLLELVAADTTKAELADTDTDPSSKIIEGRSRGGGGGGVQEESVAARMERERWEQTERKRRLLNAKHTAAYGMHDQKDGEMDDYLDEQGLGQGLGLGLGLGQGQGLDGGSSGVGSGGGAHVLLSLSTLANIHGSTSVMASDSSSSSPYGSKAPENVAEAAGSAYIVRLLVEQLACHARGPTPTAPEGTSSTRNLSLCTMHAMSQAIYAYCRLLHLTLGQMQEQLLTDRNALLAASKPKPRAKTKTKDAANTDAAAAGAVVSAEEKHGQRQKEQEQEEEEEQEQELESPQSIRARIAALESHLSVLLPQISSALQYCSHTVGKAYSSSARLLLCEVGAADELGSDDLAAAGTAAAASNAAAAATTTAATSAAITTPQSPRAIRELNINRVLQFLPEELERLRGQKFNGKVVCKFSGSAAMYLASSPELSHRLGNDYHGWSVSPGDRLRRRMQVFLLLRALNKRLSAFTSAASAAQQQNLLPTGATSSSSPSLPSPLSEQAPPAAGTAPATAVDSPAPPPLPLPPPKAGADDLFHGLLEDSELLPFSLLADAPGEAGGLAGAGARGSPGGTSTAAGAVATTAAAVVVVAPPLATGQLLQMKGRRFLEATMTYTPTPAEAAQRLRASAPLLASLSASKSPKPANATQTPPPPSPSRWGGIGAFFGFGSGSGSGGGGASGVTPPPVGATATAAAGSNSNNNGNISSISSSSSTPVRAGKLFGSSPVPSSSSASASAPPAMRVSSVLFVQHPTHLIIVDVTSNAIADDNYLVVICAPLRHIEVVLDAANAKRLRVVRRSYLAEVDCMEPVTAVTAAVAGAGAGDYQEYLAAGSDKYGFSGLRGIYAERAEDEDAYLTKSEVNIPPFLNARPALRHWQTSLEFDNEKIAGLAAEHVANRSRALRQEAQLACRNMLAAVAAVHADA